MSKGPEDGRKAAMIALAGSLAFLCILIAGSIALLFSGDYQGAFIGLVLTLCLAIMYWYYLSIWNGIEHEEN